MSHRPDLPVEKEAKRHKPAIIAIIVALAAAVIAFLVFGADTSDVDMEPAPADSAATPDVSQDTPAETAPDAEPAPAN
ncbi:hypothetical protein MLD63_12210 [Paracoccus sp. TK19116]|uniref:Uncharacterized protein n=1 Tax=Paracoccus albicereus TaxID=2922394 RepID=A0ABT1MSM7_9RHOB|nr:hypothetical protein [Paracoccus albicereus]MCQ0971186.1 hypothetical protein [Paracoccus albicereus]